MPKHRFIPVILLYVFFWPSTALADHLTQSHYPTPTTKHVIPAQLERERPPVKTGWGVTLRGGTSFFTEDLEESNVGAVINGQLFYNIGGDWNWGINFDWERHASLKGADTNFETISLIPYWEFHTHYNRWSPYVTLGVGINLNSFRNEPAGIDIDAKNAFAFKGGVGTDFFLTENLALNLESSWKLNEFNATVNGGGIAINVEDLAGSVVQVLFGFRWYFDR